MAVIPGRAPMAAEGGPIYSSYCIDENHIEIEGTNGS